MKSIYLQKMKTVMTDTVLTVKRCFVYVMMGFVSCATASAQTGSSADLNTGKGALQTVTQQIASYVPLVQNLIYAIAGVVAVVGAIQVYMKMNNGDQDVSKSIMMLIGACLFLVAAAVALPKFFGVGG